MKNMLNCHPDPSEQLGREGSGVGKIGGKMWRALDPEEKAPYNRRFKDAREVYRKERGNARAKECGAFHALPAPEIYTTKHEVQSYTYASKCEREKSA